MRENWKEMSWYRRILLVLLAAMILSFGIATLIAGGREGMGYRDALLYVTQEGEVRRYAGRVDGKRTEFTVRPGGTVEHRWGEEVYGPYQVAEVPSAAPERYMTGLEIRQGGQVLFRGGFFGGEWPILYDEEGEPFELLSVTYGTSGGRVYDPTCRELTQRDLHEPGLATVAELALQGPELTHRGDLGLYLLVTLLAAFDMFQICCPGLMFRWSIMWHVRDPGAAEPSEWYILMERIEWAVFAGLAAVLYWMALMMID